MEKFGSEVERPGLDGQLLVKAGARTASVSEESKASPPGSVARAMRGPGSHGTLRLHSDRPAGFTWWGSW